MLSLSHILIAIKILLPVAGLEKTTPRKEQAPWQQ